MEIKKKEYACTILYILSGSSIIVSMHIKQEKGKVDKQTTKFLINIE